MQKFLNNLLLPACLILLAMSERIWFDLGPNRELVTLVTFLAAFYLGRKSALLVAVVTMAVSDIFLGNTSIALFTWSAYIISALIASFISKFANNGIYRIVLATFGGVLTTFWFYLWTNFGVWLFDSWRMYADDLSGLAASYAGGLPFLKLQLTSNLFILAAGFGLVEGVYFAGKNIFQHTFFLKNYE